LNPQRDRTRTCNLAVNSYSHRPKSENAVFVHFLRNNEACGYYAESQREVDFVIGDFKKPLPVLL